MSRNNLGYGARISRAILMAVLPTLAAGLAVSSPVMAQAGFSEGYKFLEAVKKKDGAKVEEALLDPSSQIINSRDVTTGETALHIVTARRDLTWLNYLISHGANVNAADDHGRTPLEMAVNLGWREGAEFLLESKASPDPSNDAGETPLIYAVHRKDLQLVKALLQAGADPNRADNSGRSARDYAALDSKTGPMTSVLDEYAAKNKKKAQAVYGPVM
ncbi:Ankyrin repeat [Novosphingobium mathurense]|uniref:Ankyrin repeat n=2 Tax=Novosphingobium mathurense TaxID=428990 RepID=A0A1U6HNZ7_9SPHN|nr:Ankyrin repeat [Novosphingobium mathurense]